MHDKTVSFTATQVLATATGLAAYALVLLNFWTPGDDLGFAGVMFGGLSAVLRIRAYMVTCMNRLIEREVNAFELGRDSVRSLR